MVNQNLGSKKFRIPKMRRKTFQIVAAIWVVMGNFSIATAGLCAQDPQQVQAQTPPASVADPAYPPANDPEAMLPHFKDTRFWLSGQMNFIFQAHPNFHAAYSGPNSLSPHYEKATSRVMTLYTGVRLNDSTEF